MEAHKLLKTAGIFLLAGLALWLTAAFLLPLLLPFFLAFLLALATQKPAQYLMERCRLPRWAAGGICTLAAYLLLFLAVFLLGRRLTKELSHFGARLPALLQGLSGPLDYLHYTLRSTALRLPDGLGAGLSQVVDEFFTTGAGLLQALPQTLLSLVTDFAKRLPGIVLFVVTTVLASFMTAARLPALRQWLSRVLPASWRRKVTTLWHRTKSTLGGWIKAQGKLSGITFCLTTAGLFLLRVPSPLLSGLLTACVDILPVFGAGTVLIPWAMVLFLQGDPGSGIAFLLLYGVVAVTRITLEPRFVGRQMGLPPLLTLASIYAGGKLCGIAGLILFPLAASVLARFAKLSRP